MKKVKRYNAGGYEDTDDAKNLEAAAEREKADAEKPAEPLKMASFKEAFAEARKAGDKTFEYMGKKYTTEMAGAKKPAASTTSTDKAGSKPKASSYAEASKSGRTLGDVIKSDASESADYRKRVAEGKEKTFGTKLQEGFRRFGRALSTGRPQGEGMKKGGMVSSASKRADGCATKGKTRGRMV